MILFRPIGLRELELIAEADFRAFPPRLAHQPIFYPVLTEEYAHEIARDWNTADAASGYVGFVTRFELEDGFAARYPVQGAGAARHRELWVPAEDLPTFNRHIVGTISVVATYVGAAFAGRIDPESLLPSTVTDGGHRGLRTVYRLREDTRRVEQIQRATLNTSEFGIEITHGLFASDEWWAHVDSGALTTHTLKGTITRVYMGSMGDWPEFEVCDAAGEVSQWTREVTSAELDGLYQHGRHVEIDYVVQRHRPGAWDGGAETKVVLEIRLTNAV